MTDPITRPLTDAMPHTLTSRRAFLGASLSLPVGALLAACALPTVAPSADAALPAVTAQSADLSLLAPTPVCGDDDDEPTLAQTAGPYYTPNSPERSSLLTADTVGDRLQVQGFVLTPGCLPVAQALVDFWHCDAAGVYDNQGYNLRGHQFTDAQGRYQLETIVPGIYPGRTRHIHVKVQAPNGPVLITQLYFPDEPQNARDRIFHPALVMATSPTDAALLAGFNFVLA
jgi:protocatechuate 3,4-dioxygenase beta subunit